jgi:hypothetical protein
MKKTKMVITEEMMNSDGEERREVEAGVSMRRFKYTHWWER